MNQSSLDDFVRDAMREHDHPGSDPPDEVPAAHGSLTGHTLKDSLGRGGMGMVYRARQQSLEREVAVKVMTARARTPEMAERFRREALVLGRLEHPNIVPIHDLGMDDNGQLYYTMKLVKGRTLAAILVELRGGDDESLRRGLLPALLTIFRKV